MLYPINSAQKITIVFSRYKLLNADFNLTTERFLSVQEIDQYGFWLGCGSCSVWVAELQIPSTIVGARPCWWTTVRYPACQPRPLSSCCYWLSRPCVSIGCPQASCLLWWWLMGVILIH
ncbi:hypothetical protein KJ591_03980 [Patescibacteria group bacterium]|nr:hypothetical protein [Patescibacteria group bacterium]